MIYFITFLCSLFIQFSAINFPLNYYDVNLAFSSRVDIAINAINSRGFNLDKEYVIFANRNNGAAPYAVFYPMELIDSSYSSSLFVYSRSTTSMNVTSTNFVRFLLNDGYGVVSGPSSPSNAASYITNMSSVGYYDIETNTTTFENNILYNSHYPFTYNGIDTFVFDRTPQVIGFNGHSTGWSDLLVNDEETGEIFTMLGHGLTFDEDSITYLNNYWELHSGEDFETALLAAQTRILSGISDSLSFGLGIIGKDMDDLLQWCDDFLSLFGTSLEALSDKYLELIGVSSDINDKLDGYIDYVSEPFDAAEWDLMMSTGTIGDFSDIAHSIHQMTTQRTDSQHIYISWNFGNIHYFGDASGRVDMVEYLNPSKSTWQPLILTFLYAAILWQFVKSLPNLLQGASSSVNTETRNVKNP